MAFTERSARLPAVRGTQPLARGLMLIAMLALAPHATGHGGIAYELQRVETRLQSQPHDVEALLERAALQRLRGDYGAALADLNNLADRAPTLPELCFQRGMTLAALGYPAEAELDLSYVLSVRPTSRRALVTRATLYEQLGQRSWAVRDYRAALALAPSVDVVLALGRLFERSGALDDAAACYANGLSELHDAEVIKQALVRIEAERGHLDRAIALVDTMIASRSFKAEAYLQRAELHDANGAASLALADRRTALSLIDRSLLKRPSALRRLSRAKALLALKRTDEARRDLELALNQSPSLREAQELLNALHNNHEN